MAEIGAIQAPIPIPNPNLLHPEQGQRQSSATFPLRATPPVFRALGRAGNVDLSAMSAALVPTLPLPPTLLGSRARFRLLPTTPPRIELAAQTHTRALGSPTLHPQARVASLGHSRSLGTIAVTVPPVEPPVEPPVPPPFTPVASPRTLRYVRRRNRPRERGS